MKPYHRLFKSTLEAPASRGFGQAPPDEGPEIPELKKKEEERREAGLPLGSLAAGESVSVSGGMLGFGPVARSLSTFFGGPGTMLGALFASEFGEAALALGALSWAIVVAMAVAAALTRESGARKDDAVVFPSLAPTPSSGIVIRTPYGRSLDYVSRANAGELSFDQEHPLAPKDAAPAARAEGKPAAPAAPPQAPPQAPNVNALLKKVLAAEGIGKMSAGGGSFAGGASLNQNKLGTKNFELKKTFSSLGTGGQFKLVAFKKPVFRSADGGVGRSAAGGASRAMGQLKFASAKSKQAYATSDADAAKQAATDAFEQGKTSGGDALGLTSPGGDAVVPASTLSDTSSIPSVSSGTNTTPYQNQVDSAKNSSNNAGLYKAIGIALLIAGAALIVTGIGLLNCTTFPIGLAMIGAGAALMAMGILFLLLGLSEAASAANNGSNISNNYGQTGQGSTVSNCAQQSYDTGTNADTVCGTSGTYDTSKGNNVSSSANSTSNASSAK